MHGSGRGVYGGGAMNQQSSIDSTMSSPLGADVISRRAYELWEKEGRPEGCDRRHWLQAEQELRSDHASNVAPAENDSGASRFNRTDTRPPQGTRASANRGSKRGSDAPIGSEKNASSSNNQNAGRRKPSSAPGV